MTSTIILAGRTIAKQKEQIQALTAENERLVSENTDLQYNSEQLELQRTELTEEAGTLRGALHTILDDWDNMTYPEIKSIIENVLNLTKP